MSGKISASKTRNLLDEAFAEFETAQASDSEFDGSLPAEEETEATGEEFDEGAGEGDTESGEFSLEDDGEGEDLGDDAGEGESEDLGDDSEELSAEFSLDDEGSEAGDESDDSVEAVYATVEEIEAEFEAIAREQGLDRLPQGVTASETIDFLLDQGAIWELKPITASEGKRRRTAIAAFDEDGAEDEDFGGEDAEDGVESPVLDNSSDDSEEDSEIDLGIDLDAEPTDLDDDGDDESAEGTGEHCEAEETSVSASVSAQGQHYHPVADAEIIATASASDVQMLLTDGQDPRWNVIIAGVPAACIRLSSLEAGEAVRSGFTSKGYSESVIAAMSKLGVAEVLSQNGAEFYGNSYQGSELAQEIRASVETELSSDYTTRVVAMREDFIDRVNLVVAGQGKGYFSNLPNPLFIKAREVLASRGVHDADAAAMAIVSAAAEFVAVAAEKAVTLMDKSPDFIQDLRENIDDTATRAPVATATASLAARLEDQTLTSPAYVAPTRVAASTHSAPIATHLQSLVGKLGSKTGFRG